MSYFNNLTLNTNSPSGDAFGRLRVGTSQTLFDNKLINDSQPLYWDDQEVSGSGTSSVYQTNQASQLMSVSATTAGKRVRQTFQRFDYQAGKGGLVIMTALPVESGHDSGITSRFGLFDDENGFFFQTTGGGTPTYSLGVRSYTTGSAVDTTVVQSLWNLDKLDGTGNSGLVIDFTTSQIFIIDFAWLGVGRIRMGFDIRGTIVYCHEFVFLNSLSSVYMSTPNLPARYEIENDGTGSASGIKQICTTVLSEAGAINRLGFPYYRSTRQGGGGVISGLSSGTLYAGIGIRLKSTNLDTNILLKKASTFVSTNDGLEWCLVKDPTVGGTFTYSSVSANSGLEIAYGSGSANTITGGEIMFGGFVAKESATFVGLDSTRAIGSYIDGTPEEFVLCIRPLGAGADIDVGMGWQEAI